MSTALRIAVSLLALAGAAAVPAAPPTYRVVALLGAADETGSQGRAINAAGDVAGIQFRRGLDQPLGVVWPAGSGTVLVLPDVAGSVTGPLPTAINDAGVVVGSVNPGGRTTAARWVGGAGPQLMAPLTSKGGAGASAVNAGGVAVGYAERGLSLVPVQWAPDGSITLLGARSGRAQAINGAGTVVGEATIAGAKRAFVVAAGGRMRALAELPGGFEGGSAAGLNELGQAVGHCEGDIGGQPAIVACLWSTSGEVQDLGRLGGRITEYEAHGINNAGQVVGSWSINATGSRGGFLWTAQDGMVDLRTRVDPGDPLASYLDDFYAAGINDAGIIVGTAVLQTVPNQGKQQAVLLVPAAP